MDSVDELKELYGKLAADLSRTGTPPGHEALEQHRRHLEQLDDRMREVVDDRERAELGEFSRDAHSRWDKALGELEHPTILSPRPVVSDRSPLADRGPSAFTREAWDGFDR